MALTYLTNSACKSRLTVTFKTIASICADSSISTRIAVTMWTFCKKTKSEIEFTQNKFPRCAVIWLEKKNKKKTEDNRNFTLKISHLIGTIFLSMALDIYRHNRSQDQDNFHCSNKDWSCIHWYLPRERKPKTALRECLFHQNFIGLLQNHLQLKT